VSTPDESKTPYSLEDIGVGANAPPPDIDDERTKAEAAYYDKEAKALTNVETAVKISFFKKYLPVIIKLSIAYTVVVLLLVVASGLHPYGFSVAPSVLVALIGAPFLVALLGLLPKLL
jgi:hypothetical protein